MFKVKNLLKRSVIREQGRKGFVAPSSRQPIVGTSRNEMSCDELSSVVNAIKHHGKGSRESSLPPYQCDQIGQIIELWASF